jgi:hypothetical protein
MPYLQEHGNIYSSRYRCTKASRDGIESNVSVPRGVIPRSPISYNVHIMYGMYSDVRSLMTYRRYIMQLGASIPAYLRQITRRRYMGRQAGQICTYVGINRIRVSDDFLGVEERKFGPSVPVQANVGRQPIGSLDDYGIL